MEALQCAVEFFSRNYVLTYSHLTERTMKIILEFHCMFLFFESLNQRSPAPWPQPIPNWATQVMSKHAWFHLYEWQTLMHKVYLCECCVDGTACMHSPTACVKPSPLPRPTAACPQSCSKKVGGLWSKPSCHFSKPSCHFFSFGV